MKKTVSRKKTTQNSRKRAVKPRKRRKKAGFSDGLRAFLLTGAIVAVSAAVSFSLIMYHSARNREDAAVSRGGELTQMPVVEPVREIVSIEPETAVTKSPSISESSPKPDVKVTTEKPPQSKSAPPARPAPAAKTSTAVTDKTSTAAKKPPEKPAENLGNLVVVIDDAGNNLRELEPFLRLSYPLTIAVLPGLPHSAEAARRIRAAGKEVFLHQPMEAIGAQNPGPGAIYSNMSGEEIRAVLKRNIEEIGPVAGINNHQGSKITMDREAVQTILAFCAENGIYFMDSRTTAETVVPAEAQKLGIKITQRDVFIDNEKDKASMLRSISGGLEKAKKNGNVVMIGHAWSPQLAPLLAEQFPLLTNQGYTVKTVSNIIGK